jgi:hypothetical protein
MALPLLSVTLGESFVEPVREKLLTLVHGSNLNPA